MPYTSKRQEEGSAHMYRYMYSTCTSLQHTCAHTVAMHNTCAHTVAMHNTCDNAPTSMCCTSCYAILTGQIFSFGVPSTRMTIHN